MPTAAKTKQLEVPPLKIKTVRVEIVGNSRLVLHKFADKTRRQMLDKQRGKGTVGRELKDPVADFVGAMYLMPGKTALDLDLHDEDYEETGEAYATGPFAIPAVVFKAAGVRAANDAGMRMTDARKLFHVLGEFLPIEAEAAYLREDLVRVANGNPDIRFRPEFREWRVWVPIKFNENLFTTEKLVNLLRLAGFGVGVGEGRPFSRESVGMGWGTFDVGDVEEMGTVQL